MQVDLLLFDSTILKGIFIYSGSVINALVNLRVRKGKPLNWYCIQWGFGI